MSIRSRSNQTYDGWDWQVCWAVVAVLFLLVPNPVRAGYFLYPSGSGQVIVATTFSQADTGFSSTGRFIPYDRFRKLEANAYIEFGVSDTVTAVIKPSFTRASTSVPSEIAAAQAGAGSQAGARVHLWHFGSTFIAAEASVVLPDFEVVRSRQVVQSERGGSDLRLLVGRTFSLGSWPSFVDGQLAYRWHIGPAPDEVHADATLGVRPRAALLILLQSFNTIAAGPAGHPFQRYRNHKIQLSTVYSLTEVWAIQLGALATPAGRNAPAELGAVAAVWRRF